MVQHKEGAERNRGAEAESRGVDAAAAFQWFIRPDRLPSIPFLLSYSIRDTHTFPQPSPAQHKPISHLVEPIFVVVPADVEGLEDGVLKLYTPDPEALADRRSMTPTKR